MYIIEHLKKLVYSIKNNQRQDAYKAIAEVIDLNEAIEFKQRDSVPEQFFIVIEIDDLGIHYQDVGPWRSYSLIAEGNTLPELLSDAWIGEIDQDGGDLSSYRLSEAETHVETEGIIQIVQEYLKQIGRI